ncbi:hypothetical protein L1765_13240 [Microaerobacter geothermalis]|uniref:hypothetical protein n=1 Tax=Microaerobacter geothermalis TaxID=674972 RepID=UPI001F3763FB|nr:hypothetical protein [Microaerobacter geothermalis]MCF6094926.1 hypothetical protein [Microaerobacter geothermalis]
MFHSIRFWRNYGIIVSFLLLLSLLFQSGQIFEAVPSFEEEIIWKTYPFPNEHFQIAFPSTTSIQPIPVGGEVLYNLRFVDGKGRFHGLIQRWKIEDLQKFVTEAKIHGEGLLSYNIKNYGKNDMSGILLEYEQQTPSGEVIAARDLFLRSKNKGEVYRIAFFVPKQAEKPWHKTVFDTMVSTFKPI